MVVFYYAFLVPLEMFTFSFEMISSNRKTMSAIGNFMVYSAQSIRYRMRRILDVERLLQSWQMDIDILGSTAG